MKTPVLSTFRCFRLSGVSGLFVIVLFMFAVLQPAVAAAYDDEEQRVCFNEAYSLKEYGQKVIVYTNDTGASETSYDFTDFHADVILGIYHHTGMGDLASLLAGKYGFSDTECRRKIKVTVNTLVRWDIVKEISKST